MTGLDMHKASAAYQSVLDTLTPPGASSLPDVPLPVPSDDVETIGHVRADTITGKLEVPVNPAWVDTIEVAEFSLAIQHELAHYHVGTDRAVTVTKTAVEAPDMSKQKGRSILGS